MHEFPHQYEAAAESTEPGSVTVTSSGLPPLRSAPPTEFGGPGDQWSPETMLVAAVADCLVLTFQAIATASRVEWLRLAVEAEGTVDRLEGVMRFTRIALRASLRVPSGTELTRARRLLEKAEKSCLVTRSLNVETSLECDVSEA